MFWPFEVSTPHIIYAVLGAFIVLFGMFSLFLRERLYIGEAIWAFIFGVIIGPYCADIFNPRAWSSSTDPSAIEQTTNVITLEFSRVVLAIGVFAIGVELPKAYMLKHWRSLAFLLVPVMTWGWFVSAGLIYALIPGLNFLSSLAVAACLTPTDPILAAAVVGGKWADKHVPAHIRHLLAAESGCNDGAAFPFLYLALYLTIDRTAGEAIRDWFLILWLYQVILGAIIGCFLGFGFRHLMKFCQRHDLIDRHSYVAQYVSLAMLTIGVTTLLGSDDLLAAFFCGTAFAWDGFFNRQTEESVFSSVIDTLFNVAAFIYVGAWMPFNKFQDAELTLSVWRLIVIAILVLVLRRLPVMMMLYKWIPDIKTFREAVFSGHFGPIGIGAVFISTLAIEILHNAREQSDAADAGEYREETAQMRLLEDTIQPIVAFMVLCSITIHGLSIPGFSLGRRVHSVSRTWSRRDTMTNTSGRGRREPEWANQARRVTRAEDVVVNRDREDGPVNLVEGDVDVESGLVLVEKDKLNGSSGSGSGTMSSGEGDEDANEKQEAMAESGLSGDTRVAGGPIIASGAGGGEDGDSLHVGFVDSPGPATRIGTPVGTRPATPSGSGLGLGGLGPPVGEEQHYQYQYHQHPTQQQPQQDTMDGPQHHPHQPFFGDHHPEQKADSDRDFAPDGGPGGNDENTVAEWIEGNQRVIETRRGPGSDVEVQVIDDDPELPGHAARPTTRWQGKMHELEHNAEEIGHNISRHLSQMGKKAGGAAASKKVTKEAEELHKESVLLSKAKQEERERESQKQGQGQNVAVAGGADVVVVGEGEGDEDEDAWASDVDPSLPTKSQPTASGSGLRTPRTSNRAKNPHVRHVSHPKTAAAGGAVRPGTSDSLASLASNSTTNSAGAATPKYDGYALPRNQRLENIRAGRGSMSSTNSAPGTRESSPSRSVRFVDYAGGGAQGRPGSSGSMSVSHQQPLQQPAVTLGMSLGLGAAGMGMGTPPADSAVGGEEDAEEGGDEERKGRSRSKRRFRSKGGSGGAGASSSSAPAGDDIV